LSLIEEDYYWLTGEIVKVANTLCEGRVVSVLEGGYKIEGKVGVALLRN
jgi:acetoin utilization deacetylase AcuC-like enzyme